MTGLLDEKKKTTGKEQVELLYSEILTEYIYVTMQINGKDIQQFGISN